MRACTRVLRAPRHKELAARGSLTARIVGGARRCRNAMSQWHEVPQLELAVLAVRGGFATHFGGRGGARRRHTAWVRRARRHWPPPSTHSAALEALGRPVGRGSGALVAGSSGLLASFSSNAVWMRRRRGGVLFAGFGGLSTRFGSVGSGCHLKDKVRWASASGCV
jgi:hypothetical protein